MTSFQRFVKLGDRDGALGWLCPCFPPLSRNSVPPQRRFPQLGVGERGPSDSGAVLGASSVPGVGQHVVELHPRLQMSPPIAGMLVPGNHSTPAMPGLPGVHPASSRLWSFLGSRCFPKPHKELLVNYRTEPCALLSSVNWSDLSKQMLPYMPELWKWERKLRDQVTGQRLREQRPLYSLASLLHLSWPLYRTWPSPFTTPGLAPLPHLSRPLYRTWPGPTTAPGPAPLLHLVQPLYSTWPGLSTAPGLTPLPHLV